jgi:threonine dehydrogenase-like Zn-dependent dehydrogenase
MQPGKPLELQTLPTPEIEPGGLLVRNTAAICGSDLHYWRNDNNYSGPDMHRVTGHEFTGVMLSALDFLVRTREKYPLSKVVSHSFPLSEVNQAFEMAEWQGKNTGSAATRVILKP